MPPRPRLKDRSRADAQILDIATLIAHQAFGSPEAPPIEQLGTWWDPPAGLYYFFLRFSGIRLTSLSL